MAKIKAIKFHTDFCEQGSIKFPAGSIVPETDETLRCVALNFAEQVTLDEKQLIDPSAVIASAEKAEAEQPEAAHAGIAQIV